MLTERTYWAVLIVGLIVFVSLIGLILIPYGILDGNLGLNLISESIGILFTIVFLTWLFSLRERSEWRVVKDEVYYGLKNELAQLFHTILNYVENGFEIKRELLSFGWKDVENKKRAYSKELFKLKDAKEITFDSEGIESLLESEVLPTHFQIIAGRLGEIEQKYSKFLSPQLNLSLIRLQNSLRGIENLCILQRKGEKAQKVQEIFSIDFLKETMLMFFEMAIKEICNIHISETEVYL